MSRPTPVDPARLSDEVATITVTVSAPSKTIMAIGRKARLNSLEQDLLRRVVYHHEEPREAADVLGISQRRAIATFERILAALTGMLEDRGTAQECFAKDCTRRATRPPRHCPRGQERCRATGYCPFAGGTDPVMHWFGVGAGV